MADDPNRPVILTTRRTEPEAALVVGALKGRGVQAQATGGLTSVFRAEAPGEVRVLVRECDLKRAREVLREIEGASADSDSS